MISASCIAVVLRHGLQTLRLGFARVALIRLASEAWTLLSDDLSLVFFRQSTEPLQSFQNSAVDWDEFRNTLDFPFGNKLSRLDWQSFEIP